MRIVVVMAVVLAGLAACGGSSGGDESGGAGEGGAAGDPVGTWVLDRLVVGGEDQPDVVEAGATLDVGDDGRLGGRGPCNRYGASYDIDGTTLELGDVESTLMACAEADRMAAESRFLEALRAMTAVDVRADRLVLSGGDATMEWVPEEPVEDAALEGTEWVLDTFLGPGSDGSDAGATASSTLSGTEVTLTVGDGRAGGHAGCNAYGADVTIERGDGVAGGPIAFGDVASDGQACGEPPGVMDQEAAFIAALGAATTWSIEGDRLTLTADDGSGLGFGRRVGGAGDEPGATHSTSG